MKLIFAYTTFEGGVNKNGENKPGDKILTVKKLSDVHNEENEMNNIIKESMITKSFSVQRLFSRQVSEETDIKNEIELELRQGWFKLHPEVEFEFNVINDRYENLYVVKLNDILVHSRGKMADELMTEIRG